MKRSFNGLLIIIEVLILIVVIVLGLVFGVGKVLEKKETIDSDKRGSTQTNVATTITDTYTEGAITFDDDIEQAISGMSTEQKVASMLVVTPSILTNTPEVIVAGTTTQQALEDTPVAGLVLDKTNLLGKEDTKENIDRLMTYNNGYQVLAIVDQNNKDNGDISTVKYMTETGVNTVLLSPVTDAKDADGYSKAIANQLKSYGEVKKLAVVPFVADQIKDDDENLTAYRTGFAKGINTAKCVMVSTGTSEVVVGNANTPMCLSANTAGMLRNEMGFTGVLMSGDLSKLSDRESDMGKRAVSAVQAGMNVLYFSGEYSDAYNALVKAVNDGTIKDELIHNAVGRILTVRKELQGGQVIHIPTEEELKALEEAKKAQDQSNNRQSSNNNSNNRRNTNSDNTNSNNNNNNDNHEDNHPVQEAAPAQESNPSETQTPQVIDAPAQEAAPANANDAGDAQGQAATSENAGE